ncbi:MAG: long-chain fatty acid--CoA ligase, partial [Flammeovirgaceae bacterium]|nr:long-chain fatty acid--CoA ligase [Flammeovirgaceae bacterium]
SMGLLAAGIRKNDKVAIISENCPEWNFIDLGIQQIGAIPVPIYPTVTIDDYAYIFEHAEVKMIFASTHELYAKALAASRKLPILQAYSFEPIKDYPHWTDVWKAGENGDKAALQNAKNAVSEEDLMTIIYTSGTTGRPKGVMLTHKNVVSNAMAVSDRVPLERGKDKALSFLPLCHIYERTASYLYLYLGVGIYYAESLDKIGENIREVRPQFFNCVPRLLEKIYNKIIEKAEKLPSLKKKIFYWALNLGLQYEPHVNQGFFYYLQLKIADKLVFRKWREALGGKLKLMSVAAAAVQPRLLRIFWAAGIKICEGYGLTEASPVVTASLSTPKEMRIGCVGVPISGVQVRIADDGEILVKGDNVMKGYYKNPQATAEAIDADGWLHTGDIGEFVEGKYLKITDRKKEMFKTSGGKYVAPQVLENKFKECLLIEQIAIVGEGRKFPAALIVPNFEALREWCVQNGIIYSSPQEILKNRVVVNKFQKEIDMQNLYFGQWEKVKKFTLLTQPWTIDSGELTPTLKLKRRIINEKYKTHIEAMYAE